MLIFLLATLMVVNPPGRAAESDSIILAVTRGTRLVVSSANARVTIHFQERESILLPGPLKATGNVSVGRNGSTLTIRPDNEHQSSPLELAVPRWIPVTVSVINGNIILDGAGASVQAENTNGSIEVTGGTGLIELSSISGRVVLRNANGRIDAKSVNGDVEITDSEGEVVAESSNGEVRLVNVRATSASATSVNGPILYDGTLVVSGRYHFSSHSGSVSVLVPVGTSAHVNVSTFQGDIESEFPVTLEGGTLHRGGRQRLSFDLGAGGGGGASLDLESFQGGIRLKRSTRGRRE